MMDSLVELLVLTMATYSPSQFQDFVSFYLLFASTTAPGEMTAPFGVSGVTHFTFKIEKKKGSEIGTICRHAGDSFFPLTNDPQ